jgi:hypothetical protein
VAHKKPTGVEYEFFSTLRIALVRQDGCHSLDGNSFKHKESPATRRVPMDLAAIVQPQRDGTIRYALLL